MAEWDHLQGKAGCAEHLGAGPWEERALWGGAEGWRRGDQVGTDRVQGVCPALPTFLFPCSPPLTSLCLIPVRSSNMSPSG